MRYQQQQRYEQNQFNNPRVINPNIGQQNLYGSGAYYNTQNF